MEPGFVPGKYPMYNIGFVCSRSKRALEDDSGLEALWLHSAPLAQCPLRDLNSPKGCPLENLTPWRWADKASSSLMYGRVTRKKHLLGKKPALGELEKWDGRRPWRVVPVTWSGCGERVDKLVQGQEGLGPIWGGGFRGWIRRQKLWLSCHPVQP